MKRRRFFIHYLPVYGCISTGLIYLGIGTIAILSFLKIKDGGADESSMLAYLNGFVAGKLLIWIILVGTLCYIAWRIYEAITDPYEYGKSLQGKAVRTGIAMSSVADALIAFTAIQVLAGTTSIQQNGQPEAQRQMVANLLHESWGPLAIFAVGAVMSATALVQLVYGIRRGYRERLDIDHFSAAIRQATHLLGLIGYTARAVILGIIGFFFIKAAIVSDARYVVNTDKAFDFIGDHIGHVWFIVVAVGTIAYGLFMFMLGASYDVDED